MPSVIYAVECPQCGFLNSELSPEEFEDMKNQFFAGDVNQDKSYFVTFMDKDHTIHFGTPPENFFMTT